MPQGLGWPEDPNHATMENSLLAWYNGPLAFKRSQLDVVMWEQHYKPLLGGILKEQTLFAQMPEETSQLVDYLVQKAEEQTNQKPELPFRIVTEFKNIKTTGFLDLSAALLGWYNAGLINEWIALKEGGLGQYIDDMAEEKENKMVLGNNLLQQDQMLQQQQEILQQGQGQGQATGIAPAGIGTNNLGAVGRNLTTKI